MRCILFLMACLLLLPAVAPAFPEAGKGRKCTDCHQLSAQEAKELLQGGVDQVLKVEPSEVQGLWAVEVMKKNQKFPLYVDFSKKYVFTGNIIRLKDHQNITSQRMAELNRIDIGKIPLDDALLLGSSTARIKAIVFTDPECPYCKRLHAELKEVVRRNPDIAFWIKLFPLKMHPNAYAIAKSIVCNKSMEMLEASFAGKPVPPPICETSAIDETIALAPTLGINSTPTLVLPDGLVAPGFKSADEILRLLETKAAPSPRNGK